MSEANRNPAPRSKIAALPADIREQINQRLFNGETARKILPWLNSLEIVRKICAEDFEGIHISDMNLSAWRHSGYDKWLKRQQKLERTKELAGYAAKHSRANGGSIAEGAQSIASGQLLELLETLDDALELAGDQKPSPEQLGQIADAITSVTSALGSVRNSEQNDVRLAQNEKKLKQKDEELSLAREKFQRESAEIALKVLADERAKSIETGTGTNAEKIEAMGQHLFGDLWKPR